MTRAELLKIAKPVLFNTEMVKAILEGRKTVTRRLVKPQPQGYFEVNEEPLYIYDTDFSQGRICPQFKSGDILYVRETWFLEEYYDDEALIRFKAGGKQGLDYEAEGELYHKLNKFAHDKWNPSLFMPREAARIFLKVKDVRVERLRDITEEQAIAEGTEGVRCDHAGLGAYGCTDCMNTGWLEPPTLHFMYIWDSTIKKSDLALYGWEANPWVWVIEFERIELEGE